MLENNFKTVRHCTKTLLWGNLRGGGAGYDHLFTQPEFFTSEKPVLEKGSHKHSPWLLKPWRVGLGQPRWPTLSKSHLRKSCSLQRQPVKDSTQGNEGLAHTHSGSPAHGEPWLEFNHTPRLSSSRLGSCSNRGKCTWAECGKEERSSSDSSEVGRMSSARAAELGSGTRAV